MPQMIQFTYNKQTHKTHTATNKDFPLLNSLFLILFFFFFQGVQEVQVALHTTNWIPRDQTKTKHFFICQSQ